MIFLSVFTFGFLIYAYICNIYFKQYYNNICDFQLYEDISTDEDTDEDVPELEDVSNLKEDTDEDVSNLEEDTDEDVSNIEEDIPNLKEDGVPELVDISKNESSNNKNVLNTEVLEEEELTEEDDYLLYKRKRETVVVNKICKSRSF